MVNANSIEFSIDVQIPYLNLAIPKQYELNDYKIKIDNSYVNKYESRIGNLRKGAQDELIEIDIGKKIEPIKLEQEDEIKEKNEEISEQMETTSFQIIDVETPMDLLKEDDYHPMHIFVRVSILINKTLIKSIEFLKIESSTRSYFISKTFTIFWN